MHDRSKILVFAFLVALALLVAWTFRYALTGAQSSGAPAGPLDPIGRARVPSAQPIDLPTETVPKEDAAMPPRELARLFAPARKSYGPSSTPHVRANAVRPPPTYRSPAPISYLGSATLRSRRQVFLFKIVDTGRIMVLPIQGETGEWKLRSVSDTSFVMSEGSACYEVPRE